MRVLRGGSAEVRPNNWFKFDIELDESDLQALVLSHSLDYAKLSVIQKYRLLSKQAELLTTAEMEREGASGAQTTKQVKFELDQLISNLPKVTD